ncbi:TetR/AcrR family transcriptional regulator [Rhodococcus daqingensis]|uniref:TetR/AcrR family transcriptional regulator n=1 Tax=Rhodococcus daqingensis TaxID=2479363 RepID=A0ABW2RWI6_9NOCA
MSEGGSTARRERPARRAFTRDQVVDRALEILDEGGSDALSIRSVAARLGVNPNAVYTYVASRADLEREVAERVLGQADASLLAGPTADWRDRIVAYATALRLRLLEHPAVARLLMTAPMNGPAALEVGERLLEALADGGLDPDDAARATYLVIVHVVGSVALEVAETDGRPPLAAEADRVAQRRNGFDAVDARQWPRSAAAAGVMADWISAEQFEWGLRRVLA